MSAAAIPRFHAAFDTLPPPLLFDYAASSCRRFRHAALLTPMPPRRRHAYAAAAIATPMPPPFSYPPRLLRDAIAAAPLWRFADAAIATRYA
jgi:hypothetical protein